MRHALLAPTRPLLLALLALASTGAASDEVVGVRVRVLFQDPALASYAAEVAATADEALLEVAALFGVEPPAVVLVLEEGSDVFNAFAPLLPRPGVSLRPLFPLRGEVGFGARDPLRLLLLHELTHAVQLGVLAVPEGVSPPPRIGLVGEALARPPPLWVIEGLATWVESTLNPGGGRLQDPRSRGLLESLAFAGAWPPLAGAGLATYAPWPGGQTRYLLGSGFIAHLIERHGLDTLLAALRAFDVGGWLDDFADAWRRVGGGDLAGEWEAYRRELQVRAESRAAEIVEVERLSDSGGLTGAPALSPAGARLAWSAWPPAIVVAELGPDGLGAVRTVRADTSPGSLDWLDERTLVYSRIDRRPGSELAELFALDLESGRERQLTRGARASLVRSGPDGCLWYLRDVASEGSRLRRLCDPLAAPGAGRDEQVWQAPRGQHIVGLDVSPGGRVALSLWRDGRVDLALLEGGVPTLLTDDPAQDIDPTWQSEQALMFASDRGGLFDLHRLTLAGSAPRTLTRETIALGGAFAPAGGGSRVFVSLGPEGYDLARFTPLDLELPLAPVSRAEPPAPPPLALEVRRYDPLSSLLPYGWVPRDGALAFDPFRVALALDIVGQDDSGDHDYALTLGVDTALEGHLGGGQLALRYGYRDGQALARFGSPAPFSVAVRVGVWPHRPHLDPVRETALGLEVDLGVRLAADPAVLARLRVGLLHLQSRGDVAPEVRAELIVSRQFADAFGYRTRGGRFGISAVSTPTALGRSAGVWGDGSLFLAAPLGLPGTGELALRAGWRQAPPVPLALEDLAAVATFGYRLSLPLAWRYGDGRYALERLSAEARVRAWYDGSLGVGGDLGLWADTVLWYGAPLSLGGSLGYAQGWWGDLGVRVAF